MVTDNNIQVEEKKEKCAAEVYLAVGTDWRLNQLLATKRLMIEQVPTDFLMKGFYSVLRNKHDTEN